MNLKNFAIYLDMDGVLADFDAGIKRLGFEPDPEYNKSSHAMDDEANLWKQGMYRKIEGTDFFETLPFMPGAVDLYTAVFEADPIILTASPKFGATDEDFLIHPTGWARPMPSGAGSRRRCFPRRSPGCSPETRLSRAWSRTASGSRTTASSARPRPRSRSSCTASTPTIKS
uniref:Uncharacterized protein n=1 Tax=Caulobacter phage BL57 TaxID=3348355 RepID=A0AB74ULL4_9VIRU